MLAITRKVEYCPIGIPFAKSEINFPIIMAAKKTAKTSPEATPKDAETAPKPVAKKVAKKAVAKKAATPAAPAAKKAPAKKAAAKPSLDAIARAAYLNYRRRVEQGLPGDSHGDWLEAERQFSDPS